MKKTFLKTLLLACILGIWGANAHAAEVLDFTTNTWGLPTSSSTATTSGTYTNGTYSITIDTNGSNGAYYSSSNKVMIMGKTNATLTLPAMDFAVEKIVIVGGSSASASVVQNIYVGDVAVSTQTTGAQGTMTYEIDSSYQTAGTQYVLKVTSNHNTQIATITFYGVDEEEGGDTPTGHGYSADDPFTCAEALALAQELDSSTTLSGVYVKGVISQIDEISTSYGNATYYISDDGTTTDHLEVYRGYSLSGDKFTSEDEIKVGDEVIVNGDLVDYNGNTPEITTGSKIYSINGSTEKPDGGGGGGDGGIEGTVTHGTSMITLTNPDVSVGTSTATFDVTEITSIESGTSVDGTQFELSDGGTIVFEKATGSSAPAYYTTSGNIEIRVYYNNTITFTCKQKIAKIEIKTETTSYEGSNVETVVFSEDGTSAEFCNVRDGSNNTQLRVEYVTVYYEGEGGDDEPEPEPTGHGYEPDDPYTCEEAIEVISALASGGTIEGIYVKGIVSQIGNYSSSYGDLIYYISDDGTTSNQLEIYYGFYLNNEKFTDNYKEELMVGDEVIVYGTFTNYNGSTPEGSQGSTYIYSLTRDGEEINPDDGGTTIGGLETFENGSFEEWEESYPVGWKSTTSASNHTITKSEVYYDGQYSAQIPHSSSNNRLASKEFLLPAGTYDISFYAKPATDDVFPIIEFGYAPWDAEKEAMGTYQYITVDGSNQITLSSNDWTEYTGSFTLTDETQVNLVIMCHQNGAGDVLIDLYTIKATTGSFTITSAGYATYYTDYEYTMPEGVTGTTVTGVEDTAMTDGGYLLDTAWGYAAGSTVPAGTALVLKGDAGTYTYAITSTNAEAPTGNLLLGSTTSTETTGPNGETTGYVFYELTNGSSGIGFYYGATDGAAFTSAANKAWLPLTTTQAAGARFIGFGDGGDTTGISSVEANDGAKVSGIYTIQGVRVSDMSQKGIYIVDGRKILVK